MREVSTLGKRVGQILKFFLKIIFRDVATLARAVAILYKRDYSPNRLLFFSAVVSLSVNGQGGGRGEGGDRSWW